MNPNTPLPEGLRDIADMLEDPSVSPIERALTLATACTGILSGMITNPEVRFELIALMMRAKARDENADILRDINGIRDLINEVLPQVHPS